MATKPSSRTTFKIDATRPFYAAVGATDLAVELARSTATEVQTRFAGVQTRLAKTDLEPKALADQAGTLVSARVDDLNKDAKAFPGKVESLVNEYVADLNETVEDLNQQYADLAARGKSLVARIRRQQATQDLKAEVAATTSKAKTTATQTKKAAAQTKTAAKSTTTSAKKAAASTTTTAKRTTTPVKKSATAAKRSAKATGTTAKKTAGAAKKAATDAAAKTGA